LLTGLVCAAFYLGLLLPLKPARKDHAGDDGTGIILILARAPQTAGFFIVAAARNYILN
jgi:hypothetical protein